MFVKNIKGFGMIVLLQHYKINVLLKSFFLKKLLIKNSLNTCVNKVKARYLKQKLGQKYYLF